MSEDRLNAELAAKKQLITGLMNEIQTKDAEIKRLIAEKARLQRDNDEMLKTVTRTQVRTNAVERQLLIAERHEGMLLENVRRLVGELRDYWQGGLVEGEVDKTFAAVAELLKPMPRLALIDIYASLRTLGLTEEQLKIFEAELKVPEPVDPEPDHDETITF